MVYIMNMTAPMTNLIRYGKYMKEWEENQKIINR